MRCLRLLLLPDRLAVCRLPAGSPFPAWALDSPFLSLTRTDEEISVVCDQIQVPDEIDHRTDWRMLRVAGTLDFAEVGILQAITQPLAAAGISLFALSTFNTDYILIQETDLDRACDHLREVGHEIIGDCEGKRTVFRSQSEILRTDD